MFSLEFKRSTIDRFKSGMSTRELAEELGIRQQLIYQWREELANDETLGGTRSHREVELEKENKRLKQMVANRDLEIDFFKGALQKVEARRRQHDVLGARASTTKSGK